MSLSTLWHIFFYGWLISEIYIAIATRTRSGKGKVNDKGTMLLLWIVIFSAITAGMWISESYGPDVPFGLGVSVHMLKQVSTVLLIAALILRWTAVLSLGKAFSANVAIRSTQTVRKTGLYRWMRHPSYTGLVFCFVAAGLHTCNWISFLIVTIPTIAALLYRIHVEEVVLREHFGQEYIDYSRQTKRLIPGIY